MKLLATEVRQIGNLYDLIDIAADNEFINLKLVSYWEKLRESYGLTKLLLMMRAYNKERK